MAPEPLAVLSRELHEKCLGKVVRRHTHCPLSGIRVLRECNDVLVMVTRCFCVRRARVAAPVQEDAFDADVDAGKVDYFVLGLREIREFNGVWPMTQPVRTRTCFHCS